MFSVWANGFILKMIRFSLSPRNDDAVVDRLNREIHIVDDGDDDDDSDATLDTINYGDNFNLFFT